MEWPPRSFDMAIIWLLYTGAFGLLGIGLVVFGFKIFDWLTPKLNIQHELGEKHNMAVAILLSAVILGISLIVAAAVHG